MQITNQKENQTTGADHRLNDLNLELPPAPTPFGAYVETVQSGRLLFLSGMLPVVGHEPTYVGHVGAELTVEQGRLAAEAACLNVLAAVKKHLGSLDRVTRVLRLGVSIAAPANFREHPKVADGASELLEKVFGRDKTSTRVVLGVASLPLGLPVELDVIFEVAE